MRVLLVTRKFPPSVGGMQRMIADLATALRAECELQVVKPRVHARSWTAAFFGSASARVAASALLHRHDVLLIGDAALAPLARVNRRMSRAPSVLLAYGLDLTYPSRPYQSWLRMGLAAVDLVVAVSASTGQIAVSKGVDRARVVVIPPGFHPRFAEPFPRDAARAVLRSAVPAIQASDLLLLGVGRLVARKGFAPFVSRVFAHAAGEEPAARFLLLGSGGEAPAIEAAARREGLTERVHVVGGASDAVLHAAYWGSDLLVMPNVPVPGDVEGFGLVALEASAAGLPVIASRIDGLATLDELAPSATLLDPDDRESWRLAILRLLRDPPLARRLGLEAREQVLANHTWDRVARRHLDEYRRLLAGAPRRSNG